MKRVKVTVYDKDLNKKGPLGALEAFTASPAHNLVGSFECSFRADHRRAADVLTNGARLVVDFEGLEWPLISGPVRAAEGQGPGGQAVVKVRIEDDIRLLWRLLGWPVPTAAPSSQTSAYRTYTGPAETILKDAVRENVARIPSLAGKVRIAEDLGRGAVIPGGVKFRMHPLADRLLPAVEQAGLGVRVYQDGGQLVVDVYEPTVHTKALSEAAGTIRSWKWNKAGPELSRLVAGGQGEATERTFRTMEDLALEAEYGDVIEGFVDARNGETAEELDQSMRESLEEGRPKAGLALELSETKHFRYGERVKVGDVVPMRAGGVEITDVLRSASFTGTRAGGLEIVPAVGEISDSSSAKVQRAVAKLWRGFTDLKAR